MDEWIPWKNSPINIPIDKEIKAMHNILLKLCPVDDLVRYILDFVIIKDNDYLTEDAHNNKQNYFCACFSKNDHSIQVLNVHDTTLGANEYSRKKRDDIMIYDIFVGEIGKWIIWPYNDDLNGEAILNEQVKKYKVKS